MRENVVWLGKKKAARRPYRYPEPMSRSSDLRIMVIHDEGVNWVCNRNHMWLADFVNSKRIPYHLLWCPVCGWLCQLIPFDKAARSLKGGNIDGRGNSPNKAGRVAIQVCAVGVKDGRLTDTPMKNAHVLGQIVDSWGIKRRFRKNWGGGVSRSRETWLQSGIHGHCHSPAPGESHYDPGRINVDKLKKAMFPRKESRRK